MRITAGVVLLAASLPFAIAQEARPQIMPSEKRAQKKKDSGPRAIAVLQLTSNGKASLVPIAILINGKFWDASEYKANPVPMALEPGTVYEAERDGSSLGLFTVNTALHSNAVNTAAPWLGTGKWVPAGSEPDKHIHRAETVPVGIETVDAPPRLTRDSSKQNAPPSGSPSTAGSGAPASTPPTSTTPQSGGSSSSSPSSGSSSSGTSSSGTSSSGSSAGDEPPRLNRGAPPTDSTKTGSTPSSQTSSNQNPPSSSSSPSNSASKPHDSSASPQSNVPASDSGADEANRPVLRRGKPAENFADEYQDVPGYSKPGAAPKAAPAAATTTPAKSPTADPPAQTIPAISDASGPNPHSYAFEWLKDEEGDRRTQMIALAKDQVRAYFEAQEKAKIAPKPAAPTAKGTAKVAPKIKDPILENVQMTAYDLWNSNQPVIVLSADAHMPPSPAHADAEADLKYSILLVAYPDIYNNMHKLYSGVTDKYHLDITPRLELVDAVDADGDGFGELLFRETSDAGAGWVIYRATADKLWKMFDSLQPE